MGFYIQAPMNTMKAEWIAGVHGDAQLIPQPENFSDIPEGKFLIIVVNNGPFEAAAVAYSELEFNEFTNNPTDDRPKKFLLLSKKTTFELVPELKEYLEKM
ncbi:hypothetical protein LCGC14_1175660 [marine sediment metagenome]|uniref:Uncharacterized protein n=1 Tax=marine sediment metagenome TaxID=412755 RepID=A0A0F9MBJ2_9ZZZZ